MKKAIFLSLYFDPEPASSKHLFLDVLGLSSSLGYESYLFTPNPVRGLSKETIKSLNRNVTVTSSSFTHIRISCFSFFESNPVFRTIRIKSFIKKAIHKISGFENIAFVYVPSNPPIYWALSMEKLARKKHFKVLYNINDVYPDIAFQKGSLGYRLLEKKAETSLRKADSIVTLSTDMKKTLINKGADPDSITVIPPWDYDNGNFPEHAEKDLINSCGISPDFFNVCYIGNIGNFQNIGLILSAAGMMVGDNVHFHLIGSGRLYQKYKNGTSNPNVFFHERVTEQEASLLYTLSDVNLITLNPGLIHFACPSKTPICIECGRPIIAAVDLDSDYAKELKERFGAFIVSPTDSAELVRAIKVVEKTRPDFSFNRSINQKRTSLAKWRDTLLQYEKENSKSH